MLVNYIPCEAGCKALRQHFDREYVRVISCRYEPEDKFSQRIRLQAAKCFHQRPVAARFFKYVEILKQWESITENINVLPQPGIA